MLNATARATMCGLLAALVLSGCISGGEEGLPVTSSMAAPAPTPKVVSTLPVDTCPPDGSPPVQTATLMQRFIVDEGFDQLVIEYGESGQGLVTPAIRFVEENEVIWGNDQRQVNAGTCGMHGAHGPGEELAVEPGEYEARIQYSGTVDIVFTITARSTRSNDTMHSEH